MAALDLKKDYIQINSLTRLHLYKVNDRGSVYSRYSREVGSRDAGQSPLDLMSRLKAC